ncbi:septum site-determining protein MinC [Dechloromonas sp. TW-R-39-2]|uniref:septum site-determining protein MinC n=1 Tax=Dechloromonas sp. TW-R-39-2 TaxID=2654218 RepID=UPI00193CBCEC|nr:septum site-determining protein MinC [Dechloromonas sp. TW-R-39-2]QRM18508.1 septum site-determining protein MinC [Dechloromonas sp. TW-R-39-2]
MAKDSPIQFKGTSLKIIQTLLRTTDPADIHAALEELTGNAPDFFENELAILDFSQAGELPDNADWDHIRRLLRGSGLHAVATRGLPDAQAAAAASAGLPTLAGDALGRASRPAKVEPEATPPAPVSAPAPAVETPAAATVSEAAPAIRTIILDKPLRSGQRYYARGCDLVIMAMVSAGAEVIADGNIHVYAPLRGRALAGASGDKDARIFTTSLEAELVSVAGLYRTFEAGVPAELARQPATVSLVGEGNESRLNIAPLALR